MVSTQLTSHFHSQYVNSPSFFDYLRTFLLIEALVLIVFSALCAGAYGAEGSLQGLFAALSAYRFLIGIGIGGE
jgi:hypothetical protein